MQTTEQITAEIKETLGFIPPFFGPARQHPEILENLWQQTLSAYLNNPLPALFKEKLSAYLSRYCAVPYCMICHSCTLGSLGMKAQEVLALLESPPPVEEDVDKHLRLLAAQSTPTLPASATVEASLLYCSIYIYLQGDRAEHCRGELRRLLSSADYQNLVTLIAYIKTCHLWMEAHPEVAFETDQRVLNHLSHLLEAEPKLADFFSNYREIVRLEQQRRIAWLRLLESVVVNANDAVLITEALPIDEPGPQIVYVNAAFTRMTGYRLEDVQGHSPRFLQGPKTDRAALDKLRAALTTWQPTSVELINYHKDGSEFWVEMSIVPVRDTSGWPTHWISVQRDITERKQADEEALLRTRAVETAKRKLEIEIIERRRTEEALRKSEQKLSLHVQQTPLAVIEWTVDFEVNEWNPAATTIFGYPKQEAIGRHAIGLLVPESAREHVSNVWNDLLIQKGGRRSSNENLTKDGRTIVCEWYNTPLVDHNGSVIGVASLVQDITEAKRDEIARKQTEALLRESEARYRAIVEDQTELIARFLPDGTLTFVNEAHCRYFGAKRGEQLGRSFFQFLPDREREALMSLLASLTPENPVTVSERQQVMHGEMRWQRWTNRAIFDPQGSFVEFQAVGRDITDRKLAEAALRVSEERYRTVSELTSDFTYAASVAPDGN